MQMQRRTFMRAGVAAIFGAAAVRAIPSIVQEAVHSFPLSDAAPAVLPDCAAINFAVRERIYETFRMYARMENFYALGYGSMPTPDLRQHWRSRKWQQ